MNLVKWRAGEATHNFPMCSQARLSERRDLDLWLLTLCLHLFCVISGCKTLKKTKQDQLKPPKQDKFRRFTLMVLDGFSMI